jgi:hydroxypyruvate reductase
MSKPCVLALDKLLPNEMRQLEDKYDVVRLWQETDPEKKIREVSHDVRAIVSFGVSGKLMSALPNLEIIAQNAVGFDNIDLHAARTREIAVTNTPDLLTNDTADTAVSLLLAVSRRVVEGDMFIRTGKWTGGSLGLGVSLSGKTVGIMGLGRIGQAIAKRLTAFNMTVVYHGPNQKSDQPYRYYPDLISMSCDVDYLVLACVGGDKTKHLVNRAVLSAMKPTAFLINISRGTVVDQDVLVEMLVNRKIAGAGLDVFQNEPDVPGELKTLDNVVMTPHIGSATLETRAKMGQLVIDNLDAHFAGRPLLTPVLK